MSDQKVIAVLGATGNQGGSVADTFLKDGWRVRTITRNISNPKAQELAARGAEIAQADLDSPSSLRTAFEGAHVVFAVSDFWGLYRDPSNADKPRQGQSLNAWAAEHETEQLRNVIDAVAGIPCVERFIFSSLSGATKWSKGKYTHVYHFDSKALAEDYGREKYPDLWKTSILQAGFFVRNFFADPILKPQKDANGVLHVAGGALADVKLPFFVAEEDSGPFVKALLQDEPGKNLIAYREWMTMREFVQALTKSTGLEAVLIPPEKTDLSFLPAELQEELTENIMYWIEFGYEARDDPTIIHPAQLQFPPEFGTVGENLAKQDWTTIMGS